MARGVNVRMLDEHLYLCVMMYRINPPHLLWTLAYLAAGRGQSHRALKRMLNQSGQPACNRSRPARTVPGGFATD